MQLTDENVVLDALALYVVEGRIDFQVSIGELISQTGLEAAIVNAAISRLMGRDWIAAGLPYRWTNDHIVNLQGEGLARAAAIAARRVLTLYEVTVGGDRYFISYAEPMRHSGIPVWTAKAYLADQPGSSEEVGAIGITRVKARDAVVKLLTDAQCDCGQRTG